MLTAASCNAQGLKSKGNARADQLLLRYVEDYYSSGCNDPEAKVRNTELGPLYFQQPGMYFLRMNRYRLRCVRSLNDDHWI
jgi:hypothetical protein